jgi:hypothetical protein
MKHEGDYLCRSSRNMDNRVLSTVYEMSGIWMRLLQLIKISVR